MNKTAGLALRRPSTRVSRSKHNMLNLEVIDNVSHQIRQQSQRSHCPPSQCDRSSLHSQVTNNPNKRGLRKMRESILQNHTAAPQYDWKFVQGLEEQIAKQSHLLADTCEENKRLIAEMQSA